MLGPMPFRLFANPRFGGTRTTILADAGFQRAKAEITAWNGYAVTPLHDLTALARQAGVDAIRLKDEAARFGLGSFKALGGAYAVSSVLADELARRGVASGVRSADLASGGYRGRHGGDHRHLRHRRQSWPRGGVGRPALPLPLRDLCPRERQPGQGGRDRPLRRGGAPRARHL